MRSALIRLSSNHHLKVVVMTDNFTDIPVILPALDTRGVLLAPDFLERYQILQRLLLGDSL